MWIRIYRVDEFIGCVWQAESMRESAGARKEVYELEGSLHLLGDAADRQVVKYESKQADRRPDEPPLKASTS